MHSTGIFFRALFTKTIYENIVVKYCECLYTLEEAGERYWTVNLDTKTLAKRVSFGLR